MLINRCFLAFVKKTTASLLDSNQRVKASNAFMQNARGFNPATLLSVQWDHSC